MSAHTPGPWQTSTSGAFLVIETPFGVRVATLPLQPRAHFDAHLIAASPALLEAAKIALETAGMIRGRDKLRAAIALAEDRPTNDTGE